MRPEGTTTDLVAEFRKAEHCFWSKVDKTSECWLWTASLSDSGYGSFVVLGRLHRAHRVSYALHHGYWPSECVLHSCDTRACVNPSHLREGSRADNAKDRVLRGNQVKGEGSHLSSLTEADVRAIREKAKLPGVTQRMLADEYGVWQPTISLIVRRKTWKHVE